jgi:NUMOD4 motif.
VFREIPGCRGYFAMSDGRIITTRTNPPRELSAAMHKGYLHVWVRFGVGEAARRRCPVHRLVLAAYKGWCPHADYVCRHLDGNPMNNSPDNLAWGSVVDNVRDSIRHGTAVCIRKGEIHPRAKLTDAEVNEIRHRALAGEKQADLAKEFAVHQTHVSGIKLSKTRAITPWGRSFPSGCPAPDRARAQIFARPK